MRKALAAAVAVAVAGLVGLAAPANATTPGPAPGALSHARTVTTFDPGAGGAFGESMAPDGRGNLVVSVTSWGPLISGDPESPDAVWAPNTGQLWRVRPDGTRTPFGPAIDLTPAAMLLGVAVDPVGNAYVVVYRFPGAGDPTPASGVLRVSRNGTVSRLVTLPDEAGPNGIALHDGMLYITDGGDNTIGRPGGVWRVPAWKPSTPTTRWFTSSLLSPSDNPDLPPIGANGIAFRDGAMFVVSWGQGLVLRVTLARNGSPAGARVFAKDARLVEADGIAFDAAGRAWVTVNGPADTGGSLVTLSRSGRLSPVAVPEGVLDYPTQAVVDCRGAVYVVNGSYVNGTPSLVVLTR